MNYLLRRSRYCFSKKKVYFGDAARERLIKGASILSKTVSSTLGPGGRNICIEYEVGNPKITKDGVTVAKNILLPCNEVQSKFINWYKFGFVFS